MIEGADNLQKERRRKGNGVGDGVDDGGEEGGRQEGGRGRRRKKLFISRNRQLVDN